MVPAVFDYSAVPADVAAALRGQAERIGMRLKRYSADIVDIGRDLTAVRQKVDGATFARWVESECAITARTAQLYMAVADIFGSREIISQIPPTVAMKLAARSIPLEVREGFVARIAAGETVRTIDVDREICRLKQEKEEANRAAGEAKVPARTRRAREQRRLQQEEERAERKRQREATAAAADDRAAEFALLLHEHLPAAAWNRVRELLEDREVVEYDWHISGSRSSRAMDDLGSPPAAPIELPPVDPFAELPDDPATAVAVATSRVMPVGRLGDYLSLIDRADMGEVRRLLGGLLPPPPEPAPSITPAAPEDGDVLTDLFRPMVKARLGRRIA